jgi:hypothetical protein
MHGPINIKNFTFMHAVLYLEKKENGSVIAATNYSNFFSTGRCLSESGFSCSNPNFGVDSSQLHSCHLTLNTTEYLSLANSNYVVSSNISVNSNSLWKLCELPLSVNDD